MSETIRIPKDTPWDDPLRKSVVDRPRSEVPERERLVRLAISDPGAFTARGAYTASDLSPTTTEYEDVLHWAARAVMIVWEDSAHEQGPPNTSGQDRCTECGEYWPCTTARRYQD